MYSFQTNVTSLFAQENLNVTSNFQSTTIEQLTSGLRINHSGDDAAGLAVANQYRGNIAELNQGLLNASNGSSILQIVDGGLNNISQILDQLKTLATQSASGTFQGNRATINNQYQTLLGEITRQASDVGLNAGGTNNSLLNIYIGGGNTQSNAQVQLDLSGAANQVDAAGLGISATNVLGNVSPVDIGNSANLSSGTFLASNSTENVTVDLANGSQAVVTLSGGAAGLSGSQVVSQLNAQLSSFGITASLDASNGNLALEGSAGFVAEVGAVTGAGTGIVTSASTTVNSNLYNFNGGVATAPSAAQVLTLTPAGAASPTTINLATTDTASTIASKLFAATAGTGVSIVKDSTGKLYFFSSASFTLSRGADGGTGGLANTASGAAATITAPPSSGSVTQNALAAITAINNAIQVLGKVQGVVGSGENDLNYASQLAQSQVTNYSAAESSIRDANVAAEAANLSKAQVLEQGSIAAMAQANLAPQALLKLLQ
jgi:flagellin